MQKNSIDACVEFSFKGEDYRYTASIDLNQLLLQHGSLPSFHVILAKLHKLDTYSYLYEVMEATEIEFSNPAGFAANYLFDGEFDPPALAADWHAARVSMLLQPIATRELGIDDLNEHPELKRALMAAYSLGSGA
ncbi:MAG: hypothetical protein Q8L80_12525 [Gallionella sp.]|nr:hypothetical protein [Gallionella sp.]MDP1939760.1 hypothetical protein [Gallionella sp.]